MICRIKISGLMLLALLLSGCVDKWQRPAPVEPSHPSEPAEPIQPPPPPTENVPPPPELKTINWAASVKPLTGQMLQAAQVEPGSVLLVDRLKNSTNGALQSEKATLAIQNALENDGKFTLITRQQLEQARQKLGLPADDSLNSRSKAIGLARYVGAHYVLYSNATGDVKTPALQMQLMLVQSGEIIWSGNGGVQY